MKLRISEGEWEKLRQVKATQKVSDDELIRSRMVFEYQENKAFWFFIGFSRRMPLDDRRTLRSRLVSTRESSRVEDGLPSWRTVILR